MPIDDRLLRRLRRELEARVPTVARLTGLPVRPWTLEWSTETPVAAAYADSGRIILNYGWFKNHPDDYGAIVHEYTHVIQNVPGGTYPGETIEGFADAVRYMMGEYPSWWSPSPEARRIASMSNEERIALSRAMAG